MSEIHVHLLGDGECRIEQPAAGAEIRSDVSPQYGGKGRAFSSTDLVAAALGSCIATSLEKILARHGIEPGALTITVAKALDENPKRIRALDLVIRLAAPLDERLESKLRHAAKSCAVHRSLHPDIESTIRFEGAA